MTTVQHAVALQDLVAEEVRAQLARHRVSARRLALRTGWSPMYVSRRLSGQLPFSIADLEHVAEVLVIPVTRLLPRSDDGFITRRE